MGIIQITLYTVWPQPILKKGLGDKYQRSIKVHTYEAQNQHKLKSPLSDCFFEVNFEK